MGCRFTAFFQRSGRLRVLPLFLLIGNWGLRLSGLWGNTVLVLLLHKWPYLVVEVPLAAKVKAICGNDWRKASRNNNTMFEEPLLVLNGLIHHLLTAQNAV